MTNKLAENIRAFRKQRLLTQEQLAEVLGVTTGAVYKWEAKLSQFDVAYNSAVLYSSLGIECGDKPMLLRYGAAAAKPAAHCAEYGSGNKRKHHTRHYGGGIALPWGCGAGGGDAEKA